MCGCVGLAGDAKFSNAYLVALAAGNASDEIGKALLASKETKDMYVTLCLPFQNRCENRHSGLKFNV